MHNLVSSLLARRLRVSQNGGIAQLGERLHGMQEVSGSIPLTSTSFAKAIQLFLIADQFDRHQVEVKRR